ncbi:DUF2142 domain-containing protein [Candidatus Saccharibacteria bacterium]|nr:DUF2142 domain-containing protein [Candidatus Saccharibacteria bacterium]
MKTFLKKYWKFILAFTVLNFGFMAYEFIYYGIDKTPRMKYVALITFAHAILEFGSIFLYAKMKAKNIKLEKIFACLALILGIFQIAVTPFDAVSDEKVHFLRAFEVSQGHFTATREKKISHYASNVPIEIYNSEYQLQDDHKQYNRMFENLFKNSGETVSIPYDDAASYSPFAYTPQALGLAIGRFLNFSPMICFYLGRLFMLFTFVLICYFALKLMPKYREFMLFVMLLPMTLQQCMAYSVDALLICMSFLLIASIMRAIYGEEKTIKKKLLFTIYFSGIFVVFLKHLAYAPILLLFLLIPSQKFKHKFEKYIHLIVIVGIAYFINGLFLPVTLTKDTFVSTYETTKAETDYYDLTIMSAGTFFGYHPTFLVNSMFGIVLDYGFHDAPVLIYNYIVIIFAIVLIMKNVEKFQQKKFEKLVAWAIPIIIVAMLYYVAYAMWHMFSEDGLTIRGVHGRYFLPFLPIIPFMLHPKKPYLKDKMDVDYVFLFGIFANVAIIITKFLLHF